MSSLSLTRFSEKQLFFKRWIKNPLSLGAVLPSSRALGKLMVKSLMEDNQSALAKGQYILEIGAGTGSCTDILLKSGISANQLICVEKDPDLFAYLKKRFPHVQTLHGDASQLDSLLPAAIQTKITAVVSGIPMLPLPFHVQKQSSMLRLNYWAQRVFFINSLIAQSPLFLEKFLT